MFDNFFLNCAFYEIMWKNTVRARQGTDDNTYTHTHTHTHTHENT